MLFVLSPINAQDSDGDTVPDAIDIDDDNDGITDFMENLGCSGSVNYEFYDVSPSGNTVDNIPTTGALATGVFGSFNVYDLQQEVDPGDTNRYSIRYTASIEITTSGLYTFYTVSDDGSKLFIDGTEVVDNDGLHGARERSGTITLNSGFYSITVLFFERTSGQTLDVLYEGPSITKQAIPFSVLYSGFGLDTDGDGIANSLDQDSDNDGIPDNVEAQGTNSYVSPITTDSDGNGLFDVYESTPGVGEGIQPILTDPYDCYPDFVDIDSDDDGISDTLEAGLVLLGTDGDLDGFDDAVDSTDIPISGNPDYTDPNGAINDPTQLPNVQNPNNNEVDFRDPTLDNDNDGVANRDDRDDDNDGILDVDELLGCTGSVSYEFYDLSPSDDSVDNIPTSGALATGLVSDFNVQTLQNSVDPGDTNRFSIRYTGFIIINTSGLYTFFTGSDDGSKLFVDGFEVVDNDGAHPFKEESGTINLDEGIYDITVLFFERGSGEALTVSYSGPSFAKTPIPFNILLAGEICDFDGDGVDNVFDADSDNDGCNDADEAYADATADADDNGFFGTGSPSVNSDGTVVGPSYATPQDVDLDGNMDFLQVGAIPSITVEPSDSTVCLGCNATLTVVSNGDSFQWQVFNGSVWMDLTNDAKYSGTDTSTLTINNVSKVENGNQYRVIVSRLDYVCQDIVSNVAVISTVVRKVITNRRITVRVNKN